MNVPDLSIIVISHGHAQMLPACISSLAQALDGLAAEMIVIDNLPGGGAAVALAETAAAIHENARPLGFASNVNQGVALSRGRYILLLNPDTVHASGSIRDMLDFFSRQPDVGLISCALLNPDGTPQQNFRQFPTPAVLIARGLAADRWIWRPGFYRRRLMENVASPDPYAVDWAFGAFMLMRRGDFETVGGMDEGFRLYYEDVDLCRRFRQVGLRTYMYPALRFTHLHRRESAKRPFSRQWIWHVTSAIRYFLKAWLNPARRARNNPWEMTGYESGRQADP